MRFFLELCPQFTKLAVEDILLYPRADDHKLITADAVKISAFKCLLHPSGTLDQYRIPKLMPVLVIDVL